MRFKFWSAVEGEGKKKAGCRGPSNRFTARGVTGTRDALGERGKKKSPKQSPEKGKKRKSDLSGQDAPHTSQQSLAEREKQSPSSLTKRKKKKKRRAAAWYVGDVPSGEKADFHFLVPTFQGRRGEGRGVARSTDMREKKHLLIEAI